MPIRRSPNGARHTPPQPGRDRSEQVVAMNRNGRSQLIGISGRNHPVRATGRRSSHCRSNPVTGCVDPRIDGEAVCAGEEKGAVEAPGLFNGTTI
jgi:hypothetical protein